MLSLSGLSPVVDVGSTVDLSAGLDVGTTLEESTGIVRYLLVFVFAMVPAVEPFIVIPAAIGLGLNPLATGIAAFAGSVTAVSLIVVFQHRLRQWWARRRVRTATPDDASAAPAAEPRPEKSDPRSNSSGRYGRARRIWDRYGLPGLSLAGPILAGIHLTALLALIVDDRPHVVVAWLTASLGAWTAGLVAASLLGLSLLGL